MLHPKFTPEKIENLGENEVFVFGSNLHGNHAGGAARVAREKFGAVPGQGVGLQGQSYAIPTMQGGVETIKPYVDEFIKFAEEHYDKTFYVTRIGCGIAGFRDEDIAPLFADAVLSENIVLSESFVNVILANGKKQSQQVLTPWPNRHYSLFDMLLDETLALASTPGKWTYGSLGDRLERKASKAMRSLAETWYYHEKTGLKFIASHKDGIVNGSAWNEVLSFLENEFQINAYPLESRPLCRYYIAQSLRVARALFEMLTPGQLKDENKKIDTIDGEFSYPFFCILTGRHSCGDFSYMFKGLDTAIIIFRRLIKEHWDEMAIRREGFDRQRIVDVFANPAIWSQFNELRHDATATLENIVMSQQLWKEHYKKVAVRTEVYYIPVDNYNAPVFSHSKGRLHFPNFYLKKAFIDSHLQGASISI